MFRELLAPRERTECKPLDTCTAGKFVVTNWQAPSGAVFHVVRKPSGEYVKTDLGRFIPGSVVADALRTIHNGVNHE